MMNTKQNTGKITLGMIKGKPITTSVPIIHYHASDDELEELYLSTDEEKPDLDYEEVLSRLSLSLSKTPEKKADKDKTEGKLEQRSSSIDGNLSEGTSQSSDPWKVLSEIKGKITKTFEEKLHEIKSEHKKGYRHSKENSSISDSEDLVDVTPTEKSISDKPEKAETLPLVNIKEDSRRFGFSSVKVGLKTRNSEEDSIESGVEAAELNESFTSGTDDKINSSPSVIKCIDVKNDQTLHDKFNKSLIHTILFPRRMEPEPTFTWLKNELLYLLSYKIFVFMTIIAFSYYFFPFSEYILGFFGGVLATITVRDMIVNIKGILAIIPEDKKATKSKVPVVEIPAAEEHAVLERFEGWLNELPYLYDPQNYHVARTKSVYFRLEGEILRIMETRIRIPKRAVWDEPKHKLKFTRRRTCNLAGAKIELLPEGLIRRRRWSKKYPICIILAKGAVIENVALKDSCREKTHPSKNETIVEEDSDTQQEEKMDKEEIKEEEELEQEVEDEIDDEEDEDETDEDLTQNRSYKSTCTDHTKNEENTVCKLFIFARADRQKEDWYRRLVAAAGHKKGNTVSTLNEVMNSLPQQNVVNESKVPSSPSPAFDRPPEISYNACMNQYLDNASSPITEIDPPLSPYDITWLNSLLGRLLFDMHKSPETINLLQDRIQRKLSNIKLPYFMESLLISDVVIGQKAPFIQDASKPIIDERGLWIDLNVLYKGCLIMTVETKLNLMKLTRGGCVSNNSNDVINGETSKTSVKSPMFDSNVEDSPETSTEEEDKSNVSLCPSSKDTVTQSSGRKFLIMVDKLAANKYFQHATELSYIRKAMEGVSNTEIRLTVSVSAIEGYLSLNIPPPPSDRLWYGFKPVPKISITVRPALGERILNIGYVTKWIETKLLREFEKVVVLPNMDDFIIPLCPNYPYATT